MMADQKTDLQDRRELFSFGSGQWLDGSDARDAMEASAPYLPCRIGFESLIVLEKKKIASHLAELPCLDRAVQLQELLTRLEDMGEARKIQQHGKCRTTPYDS